MANVDDPFLYFVGLNPQWRTADAEIKDALDGSPEAIKGSLFPSL